MYFIFIKSNLIIKLLVNNESYEQAIGKISNLNYDIAIVTVSASDKTTPINLSPYYVSKAKLLNQEFQHKKLLLRL